MFCNKCGKRIDDNSKFCCFCGQKVDDIYFNENDRIKQENIEVVEEKIIATDETPTNYEDVEQSVYEDAPNLDTSLEYSYTDEENEKVEETLEQPQEINEEPKEVVEDNEVIKNNEVVEVPIVDVTNDAVSSEVIEQLKQPVTEEQEELIEKYKKRKHTKEIKEKVSGGFKVFLNVLWVIFGGLWNAISVSITAVIECITLVGIPFGIVLFKTVPLMFMPIGKRVVTHYGRHPIANTLWLLFGGFVIALGYTISALFLLITIVGIPVALQMFKVSNILWAPFGAEILKMNEFSSSENEIVAYTIQYARKERIIVDLDMLNCDYKQKDTIRNLCDISYPLSKVVKTQKNKTVNTVSSIVILFVALFGFTIFQKTGINNFLNDLIAKMNIPEAVLEYGPLAFSIVMIVCCLILLIVLSITNKFFKAKSMYDYGFATRTELVKAYDNGLKIDREVVSLVYVIYKLYQTEIDAEIEKDKK